MSNVTFTPGWIGNAVVLERYPVVHQEKHEHENLECDEDGLHVPAPAGTHRLMPLEEYNRKRDFSRTPEPSGRPRSGRADFRSVVQKHAATRLHYDFRLELDGVLKSWAVPRGPSLDPAEKRLAIETEDHPVEYAEFEGVIPEGQYGAGSVLVWDRGTWEPIGDPHTGYAKGLLKFRLHGEKPRGGWSLVRIKGRDPRKRTWLLIKERDEAARPAAKYDITAARPRSVLTGRDLEQIAPGRKAGRQ